MKTDLNLQQFGPTISHFLHRYHVIMFTLLAIGGLAFATLKINQAVSTPQAAPQQAPLSSTFDAATMKKINSLNQTSTQSTNFTLPSGRTNPFR